MGLRRGQKRLSLFNRRGFVKCLYSYLEMYQLDVETRVDVIAIVVSESAPPLIEHREDILEFDLFDDA
jgi:hypothetical protein